MYNVKDESGKENNQVIVSTSGSSGNMYVDNYFYYLPQGYYQNCTLKINKNVLIDGEKKTVDFSIDREEFSYYDENMEIVCSQMKLRISIGNSSDHEWGNSVISV